ncbi:hypothetical protein BVC80_1029g12 [Macleaya cordata]|uniref:Uncharacterized protein n=1 Tax=Macleaya cordata TaxID=56857 RepID=A0A200QQQ0_MACCD|nr:hypothetical protein BVC80_1029g12 [Macleaya cordata]
MDDFLFDDIPVPKTFYEFPPPDSLLENVEVYMERLALTEKEIPFKDITKCIITVVVPHADAMPPSTDPSASTTTSIGDLYAPTPVKQSSG